MNRMMLKSLSPAALVAALVATTALALLALAGPARADFGVQPGTLAVKLTHGDPAGPAVTQAGSHPDLTVGFTLNTTPNKYGMAAPDGALKDVSVTLPPGIVGNPAATSTCTHHDFYAGTCQRESTVGVSTLGFYPQPGVGPIPLSAPIYNLVAPEGVVARFGFQIITVSVVMDVTVRSDGSYNLATNIGNLSQALPIASSTVTLWGVPADNNGAGSSTFYTGQTYGGRGDGPRAPFLTAPTSCAGDQTATVKLDSWQNPGAWYTEEATLPGMTGCDKLPFASSVAVRPTTTAPDAPTGLDVDVDVQQNDNPDGLSAPALRRAVVDLPDGLTISPSAGAGLGGCSDEQFGLHALGAASCPDASRVGTVRIDTPLLPQPLTGTVFQATQASSDPESGDMFRLFVEAEGSSVRVKLLGKIIANRATGRLTAVFDDTPPLQFSRFALSLNSGPRAELATPRDCGTKTATAALTPWSSDAAQPASSAFTIACGGAAFAPALRAGTIDPAGGAFAPFALRIDRPDGQPDLDGITTTLPAGLLAKLKGVTLCADDLAARGACPDASRVGTATVASGPGTNPLSLPGTVALTGPYKGAPYGLAVTVRAVAGPFDLGTVVVRQAVFVDKDDAHLTVVSDPLPTILAGVPLRLRSIALSIDRPQFMVNPTSCGAKSISTSLLSPGGVSYQVKTPFRASDCQALALKPKLKLGLVGKNERTDGKHPGLRATLTQPAGQANLKRVGVTLPLSLALEPENANALCSYEDGLKGSCPAASAIGTATAVTPLLNRPLTGSVYLVQGMRKTKTGRVVKSLPTLFVPLRGELAIDLRATTSVHKERLVTTFTNIPDAAISRFDLSLKSGKGGILAAVEDICAKRQVADYAIDGQNGKQSDGASAMSTPCPKAKSKAKAK